MSETIEEIICAPFADQRPGTSGLRKTVAHFKQPHYLETFVQAIFDTVDTLKGGTLVLGGDGRYHNREAIAIILRMAAANGVRRVIVGQGGILSTPAASHLIRLRQAAGGIILSASHNPGGPTGDFGIKFNGSNGGPAPESLTEAIFAQTKKTHRYRIYPPSAAIDIDRIGLGALHGMTIECIDPVADYAALMEKLFDFDAIRRLIAGDFRLAFDAMHAVTGPYARHILGDRLGAPESALLNTTPLPDFGGHHPDPNPAHAETLMHLMMRADGPDFGAASDGDGDRNMILGRGLAVSPSDSLAVIAANAHLAPGYRHGIAGIARSMPTSQAADVVARALHVPCFETPTGWKFFGNLLDAGKITLCGEESYGTGSAHVREKDGLWAVLFWLNLIAAKGESVPAIMTEHWRRFGRHYYSRHDYEALDPGLAEAIYTDLAARLPTLAQARFGQRRVRVADIFSYADPADGSLSENQGHRILFEDGARIVMRLSGTGTQGATIRLYFESFESDPARQGANPQDVLADLIGIAETLTHLRARSGRTGADVVT